MQEINAWLQSNQDFNAGAALYVKYGTNSFLKGLLEKGPTPYSIRKLEAELINLAPAEPAIIDTPQPTIEADQPVPKAEQAFNADDQKKRSKDFALYLLIKEDQKNLYRQLERNMIELDLGKGERLLHLTAKQILSIHSKITDNYKLIDLFDVEGKFPDPKLPIEYTPKEEIQKLRVSNSKAHTRLKNPDCRDPEETRKLIEKNNARIIELGGKVKA
jgi:hypothetical protein